VERHRTGGMTTIAVVNIILGGIGIVNGLYLVLGCLVLMYQLSRFGIFEIPVVRSAFVLLILATGIIGLIAGIGILRLRHWARTWSFVNAGLLIVSCVGSFVAVPIIATIGTYDLGSIDAGGLTRLLIFVAIYVAIPVPYSLLLCMMFLKPAWRTNFAKGGASVHPPPLPGNGYNGR